MGLFARLRCHHGGGERERDTRCVVQPRAAGVEVKRGRCRTRQSERSSPREEGRDRSASPQRSPTALGRGIASWDQRSSAATPQRTGESLALDRPVGHRHPRLSLAPAVAAASRFQNPLMRQGTSGPRPAVAPSPDPRDGDAANDGPDYALPSRRLSPTRSRATRANSLQVLSPSTRCITWLCSNARSVLSTRRHHWSAGACPRNSPRCGA